MKTKKRTKLKPNYQPPASPTDKVVWVDIHDSGKLNRLLHGSRLGEVDDGQDGHTIEVCGEAFRVVGTAK